MKYSKPFFWWNINYKDLRKKKLVSSREYYLQSLIEHGDRGQKLSGNVGLRYIRNENVKHYFIEDSSLLNFFFNTKVVYSDKISMLYEKYIGDSIIAIHHKNSKMSSILFSKVRLDFNGELNNFIMYEELSKMQETDCILFTHMDGSEREIKSDVGKFIYNFVMYLNTFPESIIDGPPEEVKESTGRTVKTHDSLKRDGTISPHFRRGHFRFLSDERFTKKRGKTIFVKPTFVKGEAKTVRSA